MEASMKTTSFKPTTFKLVALCSAALLSTGAIAEDPDRTKGSGGLFETLDADSDGKVTKEEAAANSSFADSFAALDGNSDGVVTKREYRRNTMKKPERS
jgi:hypothetical protein